MNIRPTRLALLTLLSIPSLAQNYLGIAPSPYGGTHSLYLNPAFATDTQHSFYLNIGAFNVHANNNYVRYQAPFSLVSLLTKRVPTEYKRPDGSIAFQPEYTGEILDGKSKSGTLWGDVRGPSLLIRLGEGAAIGLTSRLRASAQVANASEQFLSVVRAGLQDERLYNIPSRDNQFSVNTNTYAEFGLTLAGTIFSDDRRQLSVGATLKRLQGLTSGFLINRGLSYRVLADSGRQEDVYLQVDQLNAELGYTTYLQEKGRSVTLRQLFDRENPGKGWGVDIGFSYTVRSEENPDDYTLRLGIALTDIGTIRYRDDRKQYVQRYSINQTNRQFAASDFDDVSGSEDIAEVIRTQLNLTEANNLGRFNSGLPTALSLNADVRLAEGFYMTGTYLQDLRPADAIAMHQPSLIALTPRVETGPFGVAIPLMVANRTFAAGVSLRFGPVFLGTDNLLGLIGSSSNNLRPRGADVYAGIALAGLRQRP